MHSSPDIGRVALVGPRDRSCDLVADFIPEFAAALRRRHLPTQVLTILIGDGGGRQLKQPGAAPAAAGLADDDLAACCATARYLNRSTPGIDVVSLQYDHRRYGGEDGRCVLGFLETLTIPVVSTLHHLPARPSRHLAATISRLVELSDGVVVPGTLDRTVLGECYGLRSSRFGVVPLPQAGTDLSRRVARHMAGTAAFPRAGDLAQAGEDDSWELLAERYNQCFVKAIIQARPASHRRRALPWPWAHVREFDVGAGCSPGWDE